MKKSPWIAPQEKARIEIFVITGTEDLLHATLVEKRPEPVVAIGNLMRDWHAGPQRRMFDCFCCGDPLATDQYPSGFACVKVVKGGGRGKGKLNKKTLPVGWLCPLCLNKPRMKVAERIGFLFGMSEVR